MVEGLHLAAHGSGIEPGVLALDQSVTKIKDMKQPEAHRRTPTRHAGELAHDVAGGDRLIDDVVSTLEPAHAAQLDVGNRLQHAAVRLGHSLLASKWPAWMSDDV